jgi:pimeloyl-ACP methyl ester carboxylesterase
MARHAADVAAVIEQAGTDRGRAVVAGHSMGAFVAAELARSRPELVGGLVLIDGGLPLEPPPGVDVPAAVQATLGPALQRLSMTFPTREAYLDFWRPHPALAADWSPDVEAYLAYDLVGTEPELRSSVVAEVVPEDSADLFRRPPGDDVLAGYPGPARLLWVDKGLLGVTPGLYPPAQQASWRARLGDRMPIESVPDLNHYTLVLRPDGAERVAAAIREVSAG